MIFKALSKTVMLGNAGSAVYLSTILDVSDNLLSNRYNLSKQSLPKKIGSIGDIELYEKFYGCSFVFVNKWNDKETYNAQGFVDAITKEKPREEKYWNAAAIYGAEENKKACEKGQTVTLVAINKTFKPKATI